MPKLLHSINRGGHRERKKILKSSYKATIVGGRGGSEAE